MKQRDPSYPAASTVPPQLKTGDRVHINGPHAGVCIGIYKLMFYKNGTSFATLPINEHLKTGSGFEVHGSFNGEMEVKGHSHDCATGEDHIHSFGFTEVGKGE